VGKVVATRAVHMVEKKGKIPLNLPFPKGEVSPFDKLRVGGFLICHREEFLLHRKNDVAIS
jgi:hypothetical protein